MGDETEHNLLEKFATENKRLKQRIFELEQRLLQAESKTEDQAKSQSQVLKLLQQKDKTIDEATAKLRDELKLYKEIFDSDTSATIVFNKASKVVFLNKAASAIVGSTLRIGNDLTDVDFAIAGPQISKFIQNVIISKKRETIKNKVGDKIAYTSGIPLSIDGEYAGILVKIALAKAQ